MIVGKGMIASALKNLTGWEEDILFSAGVSNSGELAISAFKKESDLVKSYIKDLSTESTFVYFSTTSVFDPAKSAHPYIIHKLTIEKILRESNINFLIVRLPNLVGKSPNPHTLTNYFAESIRTGRAIQLREDAVRHIIDVDDLGPILNDINRRYGKRKIIVNVETDFPLKAKEVLTFLEEMLCKKANVEFIPTIEQPRVTSESEIHPALNYLWKTGENYHRSVFKKYYSN